MSPTITVVTALLALSGVLAGIFVGIRKSSVVRRDTRRAQFIKDRQAAYRELWDSIQALDIFLRDDAMAPDKADRRVREINATLIRQTLYIETNDRDQMAEYVAALVNYQTFIAVDPEALAHFAKTSASLPTIGTLPEIFAARDKLVALHEALAERVRDVLLDEDGARR